MPKNSTDAAPCDTSLGPIPIVDSSAMLHDRITNQCNSKANTHMEAPYAIGSCTGMGTMTWGKHKQQEVVLELTTKHMKTSMSKLEVEGISRGSYCLVCPKSTPPITLLKTQAHAQQEAQEACKMVSSK